MWRLRCPFFADICPISFFNLVRFRKASFERRILQGNMVSIIRLEILVPGLSIHEKAPRLHPWSDGRLSRWRGLQPRPLLETLPWYSRDTELCNLGAQSPAVAVRHFHVCGRKSSQLLSVNQQHTRCSIQTERTERRRRFSTKRRCISKRVVDSFIKEKGRRYL